MNDHVTAMADSEEDVPVGTPDCNNGTSNAPRVVIITKTETGFGFNVRGQVRVLLFLISCFSCLV